MTKTSQPDILHLEACNFIDKPMGGQLTFSRQLLQTLGNRLALVGWASSPSDPIGCWFDKIIDGTTYHYFAIGRAIPSSSKPIVPARITTWCQIKRHQKKIYSINIPNVIVSEHAILMALKVMPGYNLCFCNPGVDSALKISRYPWASCFASLFDRLFFTALSKKVNCILAAADSAGIAEMKQRAGRKLIEKNIISFPTRVDTTVFHPADRSAARKRLGLPVDIITIVTTGRIHWAKGWPLLLASFKNFLARFPRSQIIFLGDGNERGALEKLASDLDIKENVVVTGYQSPPAIAVYLQASDLFVMGSFKEGWSTVLLEALACQIPIVTTRFSSADSIVKEGCNGFVVDRDPLVFAEAMERALNLPDVAKYADGVIDRYALKNLAHDLFNVWPLR